MFANAIEAIRNKAPMRERRTALRRDLKANEDAALDEQLKALEAEAERKAIAEAEKAAEADRAKKSMLAREAAERALADAATRMDAAIGALEESFVAIEEQSAIIVRHGGRRRDVNARKFMLVAAMWHGARSFSARLGLIRMPGGPSKWRTLSETLGSENPLDQ
ncbi:MAG: hypothetical protein ACE37M_07925 [Henriciella sp.]